MIEIIENPPAPERTFGFSRKLKFVQTNIYAQSISADIQSREIAFRQSCACVREKDITQTISFPLVTRLHWGRIVKVSVVSLVMSFDSVQKYE